MKKALLMFCMLNAHLLYADGGQPAAEGAYSSSIHTGSGMSRSRVLIEPSVWFPVVAPTQITPNAAAKSDARGFVPLACQTITKLVDGYCSFSWSGLNRTLPANKLLHVPVFAVAHDSTDECGIRLGRPRG